MSVSLILEILVELENLVRKSVVEFLHVSFLALSFEKLPPSLEQIIKRNDILVAITKLNSHNTKMTLKLIPVVLKLKDTYGLWQNALTHFPKASRFTIGSKIDEIFLSAIEYCFLAGYSSSKEKLVLLDRCIAKVDLLKLMLQLAWETKSMDNKKYTYLSEHIDEAGRMLGGWRRQLLNKTPEK